MARRAGASLERCRPGTTGQQPTIEVTALLDTSMLVRYLTGDPPELADLSAQVIDGESDLVVNDVALVETAYVLTSVYGIPREAVVDHLVALLRKENIDTLGMPKAVAIEALRLCRPSHRVSFADALIWATARANRAAVFTLDDRFPEEGIDVRRSPRSPSP